MELGRGPPPFEPEVRGLIMPLFINGHTHIGDSLFHGKVDPSLGLERIVGHPDGLKHRLLAATSPGLLAAGIRSSLTTMAHTGTGDFLDFREGGLPGLELLLDVTGEWGRGAKGEEREEGKGQGRGEGKGNEEGEEQGEDVGKKQGERGVEGVGGGARLPGMMRAPHPPGGPPGTQVMDGVPVPRPPGTTGEPDTTHHPPGPHPAAEVPLRPHLRPHVLSRPRQNRYDPQEINELLDRSAGLGISSMLDWDRDELEKVARLVKGRGKLLALHVSESVRENIDAVLDLRPDILIHLTSASRADLERVADAGVQVVVCPRANSLFGLTPPVDTMLDLGIPVTLGTDNMMFTTPDMRHEMRFAFDLLRSRWSHVASSKLLSAIMGMGGGCLRKPLNVTSGVLESEPARFMVVSAPVTDPGMALARFMHERDIIRVVHHDPGCTTG